MISVEVDKNFGKYSRKLARQRLTRQSLTHFSSLEHTKCVNWRTTVYEKMTLESDITIAWVYLRRLCEHSWSLQWSVSLNHSWFKQGVVSPYTTYKPISKIITAPVYYGFSNFSVFPTTWKPSNNCLFLMH